MISARLAKRDSLLFVYGTLRHFVDIPMARWLRRVARHAGAARARGRLYDLGSYPGLVDGRRSGDWVLGDLYWLPTPRAILRVLDRYEAGAGRNRPRFVRVERRVKSTEGRERSAWLYLYRPTVLRRTRIAHGDYRRYLEMISPRERSAS